jgi:uncharacterized protein YndB with AHSA1/START domain
MAPIVESVEIARSPDDVFAYLGQLERHPEWQGQVESSELVTEGPTHLGTRAKHVRNVPGGKRTITFEISEYEPPRRMSFKGIDGPIRANGTVDVEPLDDGARSRVRLQLDFEGHGFGKLLLPLVRRDARKHVPIDQATLKERLESGV